MGRASGGHWPLAFSHRLGSSRVRESRLRPWDASRAGPPRSTQPRKETRRKRQRPRNGVGRRAEKGLDRRHLLHLIEPPKLPVEAVRAKKPRRMEIVPVEEPD